jgi:hypothetical protein
VKLADFNGDGRPDIVTGWEEGGVVRLYVHPGPKGVQSTWPAVTVGDARSVEDATPFDVDGDGALDVVSCCEGSVRRIFVHRSPNDPALLLDESAWNTRPLPASEGRMAWMFCVPADVDGRGGTDLVAAGKGSGAQLGWFSCPADRGDLAGWEWHPLRDVGWIMSIVSLDLDGDGRNDVLYTDRRGPGRGCYWLAHPGPDRLLEEWERIPVAALDREAMFLGVSDVDRDGLSDVLVAVKPRQIAYARQIEAGGRRWEERTLDLPEEGCGTSKAVAHGRLGRATEDPVIVTSFEQASGRRSGVVALSVNHGDSNPPSSLRDISGPEGVKFDLVELIDLDGDGDLDVLTCEEAANLGVIWYENPHAAP